MCMCAHIYTGYYISFQTYQHPTPPAALIAVVALTTIYIGIYSLTSKSVHMSCYIRTYIVYRVAEFANTMCTEKGLGAGGGGLYRVM